MPATSHSVVHCSSALWKLQADQWTGLWEAGCSPYKKNRKGTRDKTQPCQHTDLGPFDKCRVRRETDPKTSSIISYQDKWHKVVSFFTNLNPEINLYYNIIMHHWLVQVFNKYGMRSVTGWSYFIHITQPFLHAIIYKKVVQSYIFNAAFKPLGSKSFNLRAALQSTQFTEQRFDTVVSQINGPLLCGVSGMIKHSSLCMLTESGLHLMCLAKKVTKVR